jgi:hypothetical protein
MNSLDDLELELRKLPGVKAAGFDESSEMLLVQLHLGDQVDSAEMPVPINASRIVARHVDSRTAVEIVRWRAIPGAAAPAPAPAPATADVDLTATEPEAAPVVPAPAVETTDEETTGRRARLLAVLAFPDTDELEVHLILDGRRTIGRAPASRGLVAALDATLSAVRDFGFEIDPTPRWARALETSDDEALIAVALDEPGPGERVLYGVAAGATPIDAAARATLAALNRKMTRA